MNDDSGARPRYRVDELPALQALSSQLLLGRHKFSTKRPS
jgi:hypothetical protein